MCQVGLGHSLYVAACVHGRPAAKPLPVQEKPNVTAAVGALQPASFAQERR